jgi:hypothetical protein
MRNERNNMSNETGRTSIADATQLQDNLASTPVVPDDAASDLGTMLERLRAELANQKNSRVKHPHGAVS